jgi:UDP-2,3-diacylglucosamine pyrophosphatase LpxH
LNKIGKEPYSFSKKIKGSVKNAVKFISDFEVTASELAIENGYDYVICGHIHEPKMLVKQTKNGTTEYLNSGDWVENLTALEYHNKRWKLYQYDKKNISKESEEDLLEMEETISEQFFSVLNTTKNK